MLALKIASFLNVLLLFSSEMRIIILIKNFGELCRKILYPRLLAYIIPFLILAYVLISAWIALGRNEVYILNFGDKSSTDSAQGFYIDSSISGISPVYQSANMTYRELQSKPIILKFRQELGQGAKAADLGLEIVASSRVVIGIANPATNVLEWKTFYDPLWKQYKKMSKVEGKTIYVSPWFIEKNCWNGVETCFSSTETRTLEKWIRHNIPKYSSIDFHDAGILQSTYVNNDIEFRENYFSEFNVTLRGSHDFYVYLKDKLQLKIWKEEVNSEQGPDVLLVQLYDMNNNLVMNGSIADDSIKDDSKKISLQAEEFKANIKTGTYLLRLRASSDNEVRIKKLSVNSNKIIVKGKIRLVEGSILYAVASNNADVEFSYLNKDNDYEVTILGQTPKTILLAKDNFSRKATAKIYGENFLEIPGGNIQVASDMNFALKKENFFEPFYYYLTDKNPDFIIMEETGNMLYYRIPYFADTIQVKKKGEGTVKVTKAELVFTK